MKKQIFGIALMAIVVFFARVQQFCPESDFEVEPFGGFQ